MVYHTILHHPKPSPRDAVLIARVIPGELIPQNGFFIVEHKGPVDFEALAELRRRLSFDINVLPAGFFPQEIGLIVSDMDSTLITIECIDELADCLGIKAEVAAITEAAMRGELDFAGALKERVALLKGLSVESLQSVYDDRLRLSPGAETLLTAARQRGIRTAVVSGGFTFFTEKLKDFLGLDYALANELEERDGQLTGRVAGAICGHKQKRQFLLDMTTRLGLKPSQTIAIGDGANDLPMLAAAGLGVAYHAKPKVQAQADVVINHGGLELIAHFLESVPVVQSA